MAQSTRALLHHLVAHARTRCGPAPSLALPGHVHLDGTLHLLRGPGYCLITSTSSAVCVVAFGAIAAVVFSFAGAIVEAMSARFGVRRVAALAPDHRKGNAITVMPSSLSLRPERAGNRLLGSELLTRQHSARTGAAET